MKKWCVYKHTSPSGKVYIGITGRNPLDRWNLGKGYLVTKNGKYNQPLFANAVIKYGWDNIKHEILYSGLSKSRAINYEIELISYYKSLGISYNITDGGEGNLGYKASDEARRKISISKKGKPSKLKGVKKSDSTRLKMKEAAKKRGMPQYVLDIAHKHNTGRKHSSITINKMRNSNPRCRKVFKLDEEGNILEQYHSVGEASRINNIPYTSLIQYIKYNRFGRGYYWKYGE